MSCTYSNVRKFKRFTDWLTDRRTPKKNHEKFTWTFCSNELWKPVLKISSKLQTKKYGDNIWYFSIVELFDLITAIKYNLLCQQLSFSIKIDIWKKFLNKHILIILFVLKMCSCLFTDWKRQSLNNSKFWDNMILNIQKTQHSLPLSISGSTGLLWNAIFTALQSKTIVLIDMRNFPLKLNRQFSWKHLSE